MTTSLKVVLIGAGSLLVFIVLYAIFLFDADHINVWEERLYKWVQLFAILICTFAILRIYNAVVANTNFTAKLMKDMKVLATRIDDSTKSHDSNTTLLKTAMTQLGEKVNTLTRFIGAHFTDKK